MRVLQLISSPAAGGAEIYVKDLAIAMSEAGHSVHIGFLSHALEDCRDSSFEREYLRELDAAGVGYFFIGNSARRFPWLGVKVVSRYARTHRIQIYHSHLLYGVVFGALVRSVRLYTHHNIRMELGSAKFSITMRLVNQLVGISRKCSGILRRHSGRSVVTIRNGVDTRRFANVDLSPRFFKGQVNCICVGRVRPEKNYEFLLQVVKAMPARVRGRLKISIVGGGQEEDLSKLKMQIVENGLSDSITLLGVRSDVPRLLSKSHLFLMSSRSEGLPIALIEAAIAGLPAVVTDVGSCSEVIEVCNNGICVEPNDVSSFCNAVCELVGNPLLLTQFSKNALRKASSFSIERSVYDHLTLYQNLMK